MASRCTPISQGNHGVDKSAPGGAGNAGHGALREVTGPEGSRQESIALSRVWGSMTLRLCDSSANLSPHGVGQGCAESHRHQFLGSLNVGENTFIFAAGGGLEDDVVVRVKRK